MVLKCPVTNTKNVPEWKYCIDKKEDEKSLRNEFEISSIYTFEIIGSIMTRYILREEELYFRLLFISFITFLKNYLELLILFGGKFSSKSDRNS